VRKVGERIGKDKVYYCRWREEEVFPERVGKAEKGDLVIPIGCEGYTPISGFPSFYLKTDYWPYTDKDCYIVWHCKNCQHLTIKNLKLKEESCGVG
jgi:hypothetical protein